MPFSVSPFILPSLLFLGFFVHLHYRYDHPLFAVQLPSQLFAQIVNQVQGPLGRQNMKRSLAFHPIRPRTCSKSVYADRTSY